MSNELTAATQTGKTLYAHILNKTAQRWNGSSFEAYNVANWADYDVSMTEQASSGVYVGSFPALVTTGGTYQYFVYRQMGGSPAAGDPIVNTGKIDWTGSASSTASTGSMTGADFYAYFLRLGFKRTDKETEFYEACTDAIQEMRRVFMFDEAEEETTTTDTISTSGDFKIAVESDFGMVLGIVLEDGTAGTPLTKITKKEYDDLYPSNNVDSNNTGYPTHFCIYHGQIYIGPIPDSTTYVYRISYSKRAGTVTTSTTGVPFTALYRDILSDNVNYRLYKGLEEWDKSDRFRQYFREGMAQAMSMERKNAGQGSFIVNQVGI